MRRHIFSASIILAVSLILYADSLKNGFVFDDEITIVNNTLVKDLNNLPLLFDKKAYFQRSGETSYRPVVTFTYFMDYALYGMQPWGYHLTNLLLHAVNGVLLYIFLTLLLEFDQSRTPSSKNCFLNNLSLIATLLFISQPVLSEAVNSISYREDLLAFFFYMASLSIYVSISSRRQTLAANLTYIVSCFFYFLALLSKEMALTLPIIIFCYEWVYMKKKKVGEILNRYMLGYITVSLFYVYLRFVYFIDPAAADSYTGIAERLYTLPVRLLIFIKLIFFPVSLSADYNLVPAIESGALIAISFVAVVFFFLAVFKIAKRLESQEIRFGGLFFIISLIPVLNIIPIYNPVAERYLYLPAAGFAIALGGCLNKAEVFKRSSYPGYILAILVLLCYLPVTQKRIHIWRDDYSLWTDAVRKVPGNPRAHYKLGLAYYKMGRIEEAKNEYLQAVRLGRDYWEAHNNLGVVYRDQGKISDALTEFMTAIRQKPDYAIAHYNLGVLYEKTGLWEKAAEEYRTAVRIKPDYAEAHNNLGAIYGKQGLMEEAIREFKIALKLRPDYAIARANLAVAYSKHKNNKP